MSDLIERDKALAVIDRCKHRLQGQGSTYEFMLDMMKAIPSADPWTSVLAELHERFSALEKEIRRASAEMSAIIREYVDRPKGEWAEREVLEDTVINEWQSARCSECGKYHTTPYMYYFDNFNFCPSCGADMRGERADEHGRNKSADRQ